MIEIKLKTKSVNIIKETLNRIGVVNQKDKTIKPSVYVYEFDGKYFLIHFKEWFLLHRETAFDNISEDDYNRVEVVASLLMKWNLIEFEQFGNMRRDKGVGIVSKEDSLQYKVKHLIKF
jgi:hypothetical protein